jgi:hypothetical protein
LPGGFLAPGYAALYALIANLVISFVMSWILNGLRSPQAAESDPALRFEF